MVNKRTEELLDLDRKHIVHGFAVVGEEDVLSSGIGVAFNPKSRLVERSANIVVTRDLGKLLKIIEG